MDVTGPDSAAGTAQREGSRKEYDAFISYARKADEAFATALQRGLHHLAKPWNRRAMKVFRDRTSLPASAGLLASIRNALDTSHWFVLLASPESARSKWVGEEITHWVSSKGADHLLIVLTDGALTWDKASNDVSPASTARNPALCGVFAAEPNIVDMTWARRNADLTLRNAHFRDDVATLAAAIREVPKDEIEGEDVRQQQRTRRIVRAVIAVLIVLVLLAAGLAVSFNFERLQAIHQSQEAVRQRDVAVSRLLAAGSLAVDLTNPLAARQLAVAAWNVSPTSQAGAAMASLLAEQRHDGILAITNSNGVIDLAFSPDGNQIAIVDTTGTVRLWDTATGQAVATPLRGDSGIGTGSVAFSPDGKQLAANLSGTVRLWNLTTGHFTGGPLRANRTGNVKGMAFGRGGKLLATADNDGTIQLWDTATGHRARTALHTGFDEADGVAFSPDGNLLAVTGQSRVQLWDLATGRPVASPQDDDVDSATFSLDGKLLALVNKDGTVELWDLTTGRRLAAPPHTGDAFVAAFTPNERLFLATISPDTGITAELWDPATSQRVGSLIHDHDGLGGLGGVAISPNGTLMTTADSDGFVRLWDLTTGQAVGNTLHAGTSRVYDAAFSPDGKLLATDNYDGTVRLWDSATEHPIGRPLPTAPGGIVDGVAFSPDGRLLATNDHDGTVQLWDVATGQAIGNPLSTGSQGVAFSPDGKLLATAGSDGSVWLSDPATGQAIGGLIFTGSVGGVNGVAFSPDGKLLATADSDGRIQLWGLATRLPVETIRADSHLDKGAYRVTFSPDGKLLAIANSDGTAWLWDLAADHRVGAPIPVDPGGAVNDVAFSPNGKLLATAEDDGTARLWDSATGRPVGIPIPADPAGAVHGVAFSPDGKLLATAEDDGTARLWEVAQFTDPYHALCADVGPPTREVWNEYSQGAPFRKICVNQG